MKVLIDHSSYFFLEHGGFQRQIEQTKWALEQNGVDVEWVRWWDDRQKGDLIQFFGRANPGYITSARMKGMRFVMAELLTGLGSRKPALRYIQGMLIKALQGTPIASRLGWGAYREADAVVAGTPWEAKLMREVFGAPAERVHIVPNGVEELFFQKSAEPRGPWLVCAATLHPRKRVLELAEAAIAAETPLWVIGKPYTEEDDYYRAFLEIAKTRSDLIRYEGSVESRETLARIYRAARGFVLLSTMETRSLSSEEAAASECPLLLSDLPWARSVFGETASYCPIESPRQTAVHLKSFYGAAPHLAKPTRPTTWQEVGALYRAVYTQVLGISK